MGIYLGDVEQDVWLGDVEQDVWLGDVQQNEGGVAFNFLNALELSRSDYVLFNDTSVYCDTNLPWSFSIWFNPRTLSSGSFFAILGLKTNGADPFIVFYPGSVSASYSMLSFGSRSEFNKFRIKANSEMPINQWNHVLITYSGADPLDITSFKCYFNGVDETLISSGNFGGNQNDSTLSLIGSDKFDGIEDEISFWDTELTSAQALNQWNNGNGNFANIDVAPRTWLGLNQSGSDTVAIDSSGNGNDGTLTNFDFTTSPWVDHYSGIPTSINTNVANQTYSYQGNSVEQFIQIFFDNADTVTTGRTINISGLTINSNTQIMINDLVNNRGFNIVT